MTAEEVLSLLFDSFLGRHKDLNYRQLAEKRSLETDWIHYVTPPLHEYIYMYVSFTYINFKAKIVTKYSSKKNIL
jgi:hypothetical protein